MINKLIKLAKQEGMFDTAFLLAEKNNLKEELYNSLRKDYDITFKELKHQICLNSKNGHKYIDRYLLQFERPLL